MKLDAIDYCVFLKQFDFLCKKYPIKMPIIIDFLQKSIFEKLKMAAPFALDQKGKRVFLIFYGILGVNTVLLFKLSFKSISKIRLTCFEDLKIKLRLFFSFSVLLDLLYLIWVLCSSGCRAIYIIHLGFISHRIFYGDYVAARNECSFTRESQFL